MPENPPLAEPARRHLASIRRHYDEAATDLLWPAAHYRRWLAHYYNLLIPENASVLEIGCGAGHLLAQLKTRDLAGIDISERQIEAARRRLPQGTFSVQAGEDLNLDRRFDVIIVSDVLSLAADVQVLLERLHQVSTPQTRLLLNFASSLWKPLFFAARLAGWRAPQPETSWLSPADVRNLLQLAGWESVKTTPRILLPAGWARVDTVVNRWLAPLLPWFCLTNFCVARPLRQRTSQLASVSLIVPARNEAGNIEPLVKRVPEVGSATEIIFVEGGSTDGTWEEILRVRNACPERAVRAFQQPGTGKGDAVRKGFAEARGEIVMILDADLTVPPEELWKFHDVIVSGQAELANGVRLVYPPGREMRFLNLCANKLFSSLFSWMLGQPLKDTLCGTKALSRENWAQIAANRRQFGDFDPFGDFDLLFGADRLNLKIIDVPVRYRERTYGSTSINRWRDGALLFRMILFAARRLKFV